MLWLRPTLLIQAGQVCCPQYCAQPRAQPAPRGPDAGRRLPQGRHPRAGDHLQANQRNSYEKIRSRRLPTSTANRSHDYPCGAGHHRHRNRPRLFLGPLPESSEAESNELRFMPSLPASTVPTPLSRCHASSGAPHPRSEADGAGSDGCWGWYVIHVIKSLNHYGRF